MGARSRLVSDDVVVRNKVFLNANGIVWFRFQCDVMWIQFLTIVTIIIIIIIIIRLNEAVVVVHKRMLQPPPFCNGQSLWCTNGCFSHQFLQWTVVMVHKRMLQPPPFSNGRSLWCTHECFIHHLPAISPFLS